MKSNIVDPAQLHNIFECDYVKGVLRNKYTRGNSRAGKVVGSLRRDGYLTVGLMGKNVVVHRIIWAMHYGEWPSQMLDHIDGDKKNNAIANLREATRSTNAANSKPRTSFYSSLKGVTWNRRVGWWQAQIKKDGKSYYLGLFASEREAHAAYQKKAVELFGSFARAA